MEPQFETYYERRRAQELVNEGKTLTKAAKRLGRSTGFVKYWVRRGKAGLGYFDKRRSGRPRKVPRDLSKVEKRLLKRKRKGSSKHVTAELKAKYGLQTSDRTVRRDARRMGLKYRIRKVKPRLTEKDKLLRVKFAKKKRGKGFWRRVWWTDEKAFTLHNDPRGQWIEVSDELEPREKDLVEQSVRIWLGVSSYGRTEIFRIKPFWTAPEYKEFLIEKALPSIRKNSNGPFIFEHDGDGAHRGKIVKKFLADEGINVLDDFPAHSPDIPPVENLFAELVRRLENRNVKTLDGLWKAIKEEWENISLEKAQKYCDSVPKRLQEIINLNGKATRH